MNVGFSSIAPLRVSAPAGSGMFLQYSYLQFLDVLTTLAFLIAGVQEANPMVRWLMGMVGTPLPVLVGVKIVALMLGLICLWRGKLAMLQKANVFFSMLVVWNLVSLILALAVKIK
jgi:hypothetical protein